MHKIILTFDLEYWFESLSVQKYLTGDEKDEIKNFIDKLLLLLAENKSKATFFISGEVLRQELEIIKKITEHGHEIGIHSLDHRPLQQKSPEKFDQEIKIMSEKIKNISGKMPTCHRAVNFSLDAKTSWALEVLANNGINYDSSVFPFKFKYFPIFKDSLYGLDSKQFSPYKINFKDLAKIDKNSPITEFPISIWHFGKIKLPLTGGIYIRIIPWLIFKTLLKNKLKKEMACIHCHPFDFFKNIPDIKMPKKKKFIKFYNTKNTWKKLKYILKNFDCTSIERYAHENIVN